MSVSALRSVWCDGEGCAEWAAQEATAEDARKAAAAEGWKRRKGRDLCPRCARAESAASRKRGSAPRAKEP